MSEVILHERAWVEKVLDTHELGKHPLETMSRVARYHYDSGYRKSDIIRLIEEFLIKCDPNVNLVKWQGAIESIAKSAGKYPLIEIDSIKITESELEKIHSLDGKMLQRLMFTLLCYAKYGNAVNPDNNSWVNQESKIIFNMANIVVTTKRQALMINDLWRNGYIRYSNVIDNVNINVLIIDDSSPIAVNITDFRNIGYQYSMMQGENFIACKECGLVIKRSSNHQAYCPTCSVEINRHNAANNYKSSAS